MPSARKAAVVLLATAMWALALAPPTSAEHSEFDPVLPVIGIFPFATSADGAMFTFTTTVSLVSQDDDNLLDVYQRSGGVTELVSTGPADSGAHPATPVAVSEDGSRVIFQTIESMTPDDAEGALPAVDVYERYARVTTRLSTGAVGGNGTENATFAGATPDAKHVFFRSREHLVDGDEDACPGDPDPLPCHDLYEHADGVTTLVSTGPNEAATADQDVDSFSGVSVDGSRVFFRTAEALVAADADGPPGQIGKLDVYERSGPQTTLVSTSASNPNQPFDASFAGVSEDGTRVLFRTQEQLTGDDTDGGFDIFQRSGGHTTKITTGSLDSNTGAHATFMGMTPDGAHVFFDTPERIESEDDDAQGGDLYRRSGTQTTLISTGPLPVSAPSVLLATSHDGQRVVFASLGMFTADDTDTQSDIYERVGGVTTHVSPGNANAGAVFKAASQPDAGRIIFWTQDPILASDTDSTFDLYEYANGQVYSLSPGSSNLQLTYFAGASKDARTVYVFKQSQYPRPEYGLLFRARMDAAPDIGGTYARPKAAARLRVSLVPAYRECTAPDREHGPPLAVGSCNPPEPASDHVTVGTADSNGRPTQSAGGVRLAVHPGAPTTPADEADLEVVFSISDVRQTDLDDYTGTLRVTIPLQVTDRDSWPAVGGYPHATTIPGQFSFDVICAATADPVPGSTCATTTSADAIAPGSIKEGRRSVWELGQVQVFDGGADADATTTGDNTLFAVGGVFVP